MLEVKDLSYAYPTSGRGIRGVGLTAREGEVTALMGPSGSGKSTVLACIAGVLRPDDGVVEWRGGVAPTTGVAHSWAHLVTQDNALFEMLSVWENVAVAGGDVRRSRRDDAARLLSRSGLTSVIDDLPSSLSGGQRQRVAIAAALASSCGVLLFDEPTGNLDEANAGLVLEQLRASADEGRTVLIATHDARAREMADSLVEIESPAGEIEDRSC